MHISSTKSIAFWIAVACVAALVVSTVASPSAPVLKLRPATLNEEPWTPITFLFMGRGDWLGTLFAAAVFQQFGREVERYLGVIKFCGIVVTAALAAAGLGFAASLPDVGAAGATAAGVLVAYMRLWPVNRVSMFGSVGLSARDVLLAFVAYSVLASLGGGQLHWEGLVPLAGLAATLLFLMVVDRDSARAKFHARLNTALYGDGRSATEIDWDAVPRAGLHELTLLELERVEAKAKTDGMRSLTEDERAFVHRLRLRATEAVGIGQPSSAAG